MNRITDAQTVLSEYGLSIEQILAGEGVDFDPETRLNKKVSYVQYDFAKKVIDACLSDLEAAYRAIEDLEATLSETSEQLASTEDAAKSATGQVKRMLTGEDRFAKAEQLLAKFESQFEQLQRDKQVDLSTIKKLRKEVGELIELKETVPQLKSDVEAVLENLENHLRDAGVDIPANDDI